MGKASCGACGKFLSPTGAATCSICPIIFHKACVAIPDSMPISADWICPECKKKQRKGDNTSTPVKGVCGSYVSPLPPRARATGSVATSGSPNLESHAILTPIAAPALKALTVTAPVSDTDGNVREMRRELADYMAELRVYRKEMAEFRGAVAAINERLDGFGQRLETVEQREAVSGTIEVVELEKTVASLKSELNERDQEALSSDLDIGHLPEVKGENVLHTVTLVAAKLGVTIEERDIVFAERVGAAVERGGGVEMRARRVVVRMARRHLRDDLLSAARVRRTLTTTDVGLGTPPQRIYLNERLTHFNRQLFHRVREECRKRHWRFAWTKRGRIYAREGDGKQAYPFRTEADVARVFKTGSV